MDTLRRDGRRILLLLDAYDELNSDVNIIQTNGIRDLEIVKEVISCREDWLDRDARDYFAPRKDRVAQSHI